MRSVKTSSNLFSSLSHSKILNFTPINEPIPAFLHLTPIHHNHLPINPPQSQIRTSSSTKNEKPTNQIPTKPFQLQVIQSESYKTRRTVNHSHASWVGTAPNPTAPPVPAHVSTDRSGPHQSVRRRRHTL
ncbi:RNA polymerase I-associated factor PAF67 [Striga asiatica]|uniref:RNA polymerase I-associated factor PAF67 n=1 Tax=Striga asiatica TaxID=4170 RepID=A0A5A7QC70_STRAF|nr:RNA polymerase I-associated factor PAF67 [Striga asiatica]